MDGSGKFWDKCAEKYAKQPVADEASYQKKLQITRGYFTPDMQVLEIGCGTGSTAIVHAPFVRHIRAVDISPEMLRIAQAKADAQGITNISFECSPADELRVEAGSMDMVMAHSILHLLEEKEAVIARIYDMLRPGGLFVSSTICMSDAMWFLKPVIPLMRLFGMAPEIVNFFSTKQLVNAVADAGFEIEKQWQPGRTKALFIVARKHL